MSEQGEIRIFIIAKVKINYSVKKHSKLIIFMNRIRSTENVLIRRKNEKLVDQPRR